MAGFDTIFYRPTPNFKQVFTERFWKAQMELFSPGGRQTIRSEDCYLGLTKEDETEFERSATEDDFGHDMYRTVQLFGLRSMPTIFGCQILWDWHRLELVPKKDFHEQIKARVANETRK